MEKIDFLHFGRRTVNIGDEWLPRGKVKHNKLYCVYGGEASYNGCKLTAGHIYIITDCSGDWELHESFDHLYFDFLLGKRINLTVPREINTEMYPAIYSLCNSMVCMLENYPREELVKETECLLSSILMLCDKISPFLSTGDLRIDSVIDRISTSDELLSVDQLAATAGLDKYYFIKLFKRVTGCTPGKYALEVRLNRSLNLLETRAPISEIAESVGFLSVSAFTYAFKRHFGKTPSEMRREIFESPS